jgi:thioredoxin 1
MSPKVNELARNNPTVKFLSVNVDEADERLCRGVEAMPTFVLWALGENGPEVIDDVMGANLKGLKKLVSTALKIEPNSLHGRSKQNAVPTIAPHQDANVTREESFVQPIKTVPEFLEYLQSYPAVILDFHAPSCGPCKQMSPKVNELARNNPTVKFISVNVDEADERLCRGVEAMPTFVLWTLGENGPEVIDDVMGANLKGLEELVSSALQI